MSVPEEPKRKTLRTRALRLARRVLIAYGIIVLVLALLQRKLMYHPTVEANLNPTTLGLGAHVKGIEATTSDGIELNGWRWEAGSNDQERPVVLFFHGNGGNRRHRTYDCELFADCGADTIIFDYRGYAENSGKPTEAGLTKDARAAWDYAVKERNIAPNRIFIYGVSLGGGVATRLSGELCDEGTPPRGLILRSTFSSMVDAASYNYPWLPVRWVLIDRYLSIDYAPRLTCPVLQMHGNVDRIVPFESGRELFSAFPDKSESGCSKRFVELDGADHNGVLMTSAGEVLAETRRFFQDVATR